MDGRRRHADSGFKMLKNFEMSVTDKITKSVIESLGVGLRNFLQPPEYANSNKSPIVVDREERENQTCSSEGKQFKEEPITPRSCSKPRINSFGKSKNERREISATVRSSIHACGSPKSRSIIWKEWDSNDKNRFKVKCNLRVRISKVENLSFNRDVYAINCDHDYEDYAGTRENINSKFANCYDSCLQDRSDEDLFAEKCSLRVLIGDLHRNYHFDDREIDVKPCAGYCGKFCENRGTLKNILQAISEQMDIDDHE